MVSKLKQSKGKWSGYCIAIATASSILAAGIGILGQAILANVIELGGADVYISVVLMIATLAGGQALVRIAHSPPIYTVLFGALMVITLAIGGCAIDGTFRNVAINIGAVLLGCALSFTVSFKKRTVRIRKK